MFHAGLAEVAVSRKQQQKAECNPLILQRTFHCHVAVQLHSPDSLMALLCDRIRPRRAPFASPASLHDARPGVTLIFHVTLN
jgi:hypothetical protein